MTEMTIIKQQEVLGKDFKIYGTFEEPFFLAKDVAEWIDYSKDGKGNYNVSAMLAKVDEDEKVKHFTNLNNSKVGSNTWFLTEDGLYEVLMQSRKPIAKAFKKEVKLILKNIRKHGAHMTDAKIKEVLADPDTIIQLAMQLKESRAKQQEAETQVAILAPRAEYADKVLDSEGLLTSGDISKDFGMSAQAMNKILHENGVIYKQSKTWYVYSKYEHLNLMKLTTYQPDSSNYAPKMSKWTHQGYKFVVEFLQGLGYTLTNHEEA